MKESFETSFPINLISNKKDITFNPDTSVNLVTNTADFLPTKEFDFFDTFLQQLEIQSGVLETTEESGSHPDLLIRNCLKGLLVCLTTRPESELAKMIIDLSKNRKHIDATHLADLIARAVQYLFRQKKDTSYLLFTSEEWEHFFSTASAKHIGELQDCVTTKEVATHVLARYRGLAALNFLYFQNSKKPMRVADIGCSLNFGLRASVKGNILQKDLDTLTDMTDDQVILNSLKSRKPSFEYALGIDIQEPNFEWVAACAYFSKYEENLKNLKKYRDLIQKDKHTGVPIHGMIGDISNTATVQEIQTNYSSNFDSMYGSMVLYQLSEEMHANALKNISSLLTKTGVFAELTFKNPDNWFLPWNTVTTVRFNDSGSLSKPYQWLEWDSSRCSVVKEGADFQEVNLRLANL